MKRLIDVVGGTLLLVLALPILLVAVPACALALRANPFFVQERIGHGGSSFRLLKVRTLPRAVPPYAGKYELAEYSIPRICQVARDLHIDELPQLLHVISGRMSLVGPRPEMRLHHDRFDCDFATMRTSVRPGCTGLWQISSRNRGLIIESPEFDEYYVRHGSLRLDLWIAVRTVRQMVPFTRGGLVDFEELPDWAPQPPMAYLALE